MNTICKTGSQNISCTCHICLLKLILWTPDSCLGCHVKDRIISLHETDQKITVENIPLKLAHTKLFEVGIMVSSENGNLNTFVHKFTDNGRTDKPSTTCDKGLHE